MNKPIFKKKDIYKDNFIPRYKIKELYEIRPHTMR